MQDLYIEYPEALFLFLFFPGVLYLRTKTREKLPFTYVRAPLKECRSNFGKRYYDTIILGAVFFFVVLSIANIGYSKKSVRQFIESKWIILSLDVSGSMKRAVASGSATSLEDLALYGAETFITMRGDEDSIGIVVFSSDAKLLSPLTFDKRLLKEKLALLKEKSRVYRELSAGGGTNATAAVWRSLTVFFSMLPEESRLSVDELSDLRKYLSGSTSEIINVPGKLADIGFGMGMSVIIFTDGRISPASRVRGGQAPNFFNTIELMKKLGVKLYIISVGGEVDEAVREAMEAKAGAGGVGRIFITSNHLSKATIKDIYREINNLEANRILSEIIVKKKWTRDWFALLSLLGMLMHFAMRNLPAYRKI